MTTRNSLPTGAFPYPHPHPLLEVVKGSEAGRAGVPALPSDEEDVWQRAVDGVAGALLRRLDQAVVKLGADDDQQALGVATALAAVLVATSDTGLQAKERLAWLVGRMTALIDAEALHEALGVRGQN